MGTVGMRAFLKWVWFGIHMCGFECLALNVFQGDDYSLLVLDCTAVLQYFVVRCRSGCCVKFIDFIRRACWVSAGRGHRQLCKCFGDKRRHVCALVCLSV